MIFRAVAIVSLCVVVGALAACHDKSDARAAPPDGEQALAAAIADYNNGALPVAKEALTDLAKTYPTLTGDTRVQKLQHLLSLEQERPFSLDISAHCPASQITKDVDLQRACLQMQQLKACYATVSSHPCEPMSAEP